ncbi:MerR family transcriptional regulator [Streptomyces sp. DH8]|uniref:MerR family transcriptional regulator n=1 Tax=Streptomyces sp. DH8 TaxID=2857008 RepID=UPI001E4C6C65|nr:MerR family transcriptional regulator [Streptomyces sp. DH8]
MQIGELAHRTGASPRALRHYEARGLLVPERTSGGYRDYSTDDIVRVAQIKTMIDAGLTTAAVKRYLDCARTGDHGTWLEMCPALRAELASVAEFLDRKQAELHERQQRLRAISGSGSSLQ